MQTIQIKVENDVIDSVIQLLKSLNTPQINLIKNISILAANHAQDDETDTQLYMHHAANGITEWKESVEDTVWN
jgi:hypothetical protein